MKYYLYLNGDWEQVRVELEPKLSKCFDTTNDTISVVLQANDDELPYEPMTKFKTKDSANKETVYYVVNDTVDLFSLKPLKYKHTLSIVQQRYFLNKYLIRNTVFTQPRKRKIELYGAVSNTWDYSYNDQHTVIYPVWNHIRVSVQTS